MKVNLSPLPAHKTLAIIMGGGAGTRLFPLTKERAKPAVPLGGKYRLVDIPISNCLNSSIRSIYVLTQFNSTSLHRHINASYKFDSFTPSFVEILAAQQTPKSSRWYQGTADAVRQNLRYFLEQPYEYFIVLSGDQLYRMDYRAILRQHVEMDAEITIATTPVSRASASGFGIMQTDEKCHIAHFVEKPKDPTILDTLKIPPDLLKAIGHSGSAELYQASMGIYVFNRSILSKCLDNDLEDFGRNVIPSAIRNHAVNAYVFQGYWEDIGTIRSFFKANLHLAEEFPPYSFHEAGAQTYTHPQFLPPSVIRTTFIDRAIISDGCMIERSTIERCVIGVRAIVKPGTKIKNSILMGADYYESDFPLPTTGPPSIGIGSDCSIEGAIIDKNARIGDRVLISPRGKSQNLDGEGFYIRDGIVVVPKNSVIPAGTLI
ncbi:MAG: glucose-1-phosphate adenylyltransferase [Candidatus Xiphinematobacter sp.]|nr:MAG: glucose-1-phosphate adenylyltransferase [Candidatus Xiphinematobacter sp.]